MSVRRLILIAVLALAASAGAADAVDRGTRPPALTGAHWGSVSDLGTFRRIGYGFDVTTLDPTDPASWPRLLRAARAKGLKLIVGAYPLPYSFAGGRWSISAAGIRLLHFLDRHSTNVLALYVFDEPYWSNPLTGAASACGELTAADLRSLRTTIRSVWPGAKIYQDLGWPREWAPGGSLADDHPCIDRKYADQTGVADYVGVWDYPFEPGGYRKTRALRTLERETRYVVQAMHATPVWLGQAAATSTSLVFPTQAQLLDWNCAVRRALPAGSLISWYVWRQDSYRDVLADHPDDWTSTTASACTTF